MHCNNEMMNISWCNICRIGSISVSVPGLIVQHLSSTTRQTKEIWWHVHMRVEHWALSRRVAFPVPRLRYTVSASDRGEGETHPHRRHRRGHGAVSAFSQISGILPPLPQIESRKWGTLYRTLQFVSTYYPCEFHGYTSVDWLLVIYQ